jgi:hypothetical protein
MRNPLMAAVCFLVSAAAFAQQQAQPNAFHVFVTDPGFVRSDRYGTRYTGAYGVGFERMFTPHVSAEAGIMRESRFGGPAPLDLTARYHFFTDGAWKPYAGIGLRHVGNVSALGVDGGVTWQFHRALGLRFDLKALMGNLSQVHEPVSGSVGLSWRF